MACGGILFALSCEEQKAVSYVFFTKAEARCVIAICEQIIPADQDPGATYAGVIHYIDKELTQFYKGQQKLYKSGLAALQACCKDLNGKLFEELEFKAQTEFLMNLEKASLPKHHWDSVKQDVFFKTVTRHTIEGFYSNPQHGGNKDYISFEMMRIKEPYLFF